MRLSCPACRKENDLSDPFSPAVCPRCGSDLSALRSIRQAAARHQHAARLECEEGNWDAALACAEHSWSLRHSRGAALLACLASVGLGRTEDLHRWRRILRRSTEA